MIAVEGLGTPSSNADAFRVLGRAGVLEPTLATARAGAVGFRNVLVHGYVDVDDTLVVANLAHLPALRAFVRAITGLVDD